MTPLLGRSRSKRRAARPLSSAVLVACCAVLGSGARSGTAAPPEGPPQKDAAATELASVEELVKRGNEARHAGQVREAIEWYVKARDRSPQTYEIRILLADTLRRAGDAGRALPEYEAAQRIDPVRPEGYTGKALILRGRFDDEAATALLQEGIAHVAAASRPDLLLVLAETSRREGRLDEAGRIFGDILQARPAEAPARAGLARVAEDRGDLEGAIRSWDAYLVAKTDDEAVTLRRQELRELRASIEALRETAARPGADAGMLAELGRLQAVAGDAAGAAASFRKALKLDPDRIEARRGLALALRDQGPDAAEDAGREFRRILKQSPSDGVALYGRLGLAVAAGDRDAEEAAWQALVRARPDDLMALRGWVACLERRGAGALAAAIERERAAGDGAQAALRRLALLQAAARPPDSAETLYRVLLLDPTDPWTLEIANDILFLEPGLLKPLTDRLQADRDRGASTGTAGSDEARLPVLQARLTWWAGRGEEALALLRQTVAARPDAPLARSALGEAWQNIAHRGDLALPELQKAVALDATRPAAHVDLALALLRAGRAKQAEGAARRGLERAPGFSPLLSVLGAALADQGNFEAAAAAYGEALLGDPADNFGLARGQLPIALAALGRNVEARRALRGDLPPIPEMMYREAWAFARDTSRDRGFNGQDWPGWRTRFAGALRTANDACRAITTMLLSLGDPWTRLRDPEETAALFLSRRGAAIETDPLGRVAPQSKSVVTGDLPGGLGYIRLGNFTDPNLVAEVRAALQAMRAKEGIVLDLRGNGGGLARAADEIGDLLVGPGRPAGSDVSAAGEVPQVTGGDGALTDSPLTVLVDGQTGSAAERLARTLSATGRASLAGDPTFGKGRAQMSRVLPGGATVLVSTSEMLGADHRPLQGRGLAPGRKSVLPPAAASPSPAPSP